MVRNVSLLRSFWGLGLIGSGPGTRKRRFPCGTGTGAVSVSCYGLTQPIEPTGKLLPVEVAVNPKVTLPFGGMVRL